MGYKKFIRSSRRRAKVYREQEFNAILERAKPHFVEGWFESRLLLREVEVLHENGYVFQVPYEELKASFLQRDKELQEAVVRMGQRDPQFADLRPSSFGGIYSVQFKKAD